MVGHLLALIYKLFAKKTALRLGIHFLDHKGKQYAKPTGNFEDITGSFRPATENLPSP